MADEKRYDEIIDEDDIITLEFEDDSSIECEILGVFPLGEKDYIALVPLDDSDDVYIYGYQEYDDGTFEILEIDDDAEFDAAVKEFDDIMASQEEE